jgi:hypothetical protein
MVLDALFSLANKGTIHGYEDEAIVYDWHLMHIYLFYGFKF